jgi:D-3-phosphoglycerate dehydrogenase
MDKTESEAYFRVKSVEPGNGIEAFVKIVKWFMGTSGLGLQEKARSIMAPVPPKSEGELADAVEKWLEGLRLIGNHKGYEMSYRLRVTALKMIMIGKAKDHFEQWEEELRDDTEDNWKKLLGKVQDYATRRRLEANYAKTKGDPMDITEINDHWGNHEECYGEWDYSWDCGNNGGIDAIGKKMLEEAGFTVVTDKVAQENLATELKNFDAILVRSATKVKKDIIDACPNLKLIGRGGVGMDNIDVAYAKNKGIAIVNTPASSSSSVAELVFAHIFTGSRLLQITNRVMPEKGNEEFANLKKAASSGIELKGKTMGIYGFGRIGQEVAKIAIGLGMKVLAFDPYVEKVDLSLDLPALGLNSRIKVSIQTVNEESVILHSDFITFHVPFNEGDKAIIDAQVISKMKKGVGLINCSRGGVISETDLLAALNTGKVAFAGLDVFEQEPPIYKDILAHPNVSLSPHIGGSTIEAQARIGIELSEKVMDFFKK